MKTYSSYSPDIATAVCALDLERIRAALEPGLELLLNHSRFQQAGRAVFAGSGDSLFAAQAALASFRRWTRLQASVLSALEFARYEVPLLRVTDVVFGVSNSGSASRTREAVLLARNGGCLTVGVTGSLQGPLAQMAEIALYRPVSVPARIEKEIRRVYLNMNEYLAALYALYLTALRIAVARNSLPAQEAKQIEQKIGEVIAAVPAEAARIESGIAELAREVSTADTVWIIGAGPNFATARYSAAKFHEQLPLNGIPEDLEEWAHLQYFLTLFWKQRSVVIVLAPAGNCLDRAEELVEGIQGAGGRAIVAAHPQHGYFPRAHLRLDLHEPADEWLTPITYHLPAQLLVLHLLRFHPLEFTPLARADDYWLIRKGKVLNAAGGLR